MGFQQWKVEQPYLAISCKLGEGVSYVEERNELRFLDINSHKLYIINLDRGPDSTKSIDTGMPVGVTADIEGVDSSKVVLTGAKDGITKFDLTTGEHTYVAHYWSQQSKTQAEDYTRRMRSNDGGVDSAGRFWVETFVDPEVSESTEEGKLFRLDPDGSLKTMYENIVIPNGITWTSSDKTMHLTDTTISKIWAFQYDPVSGDISEKKTLYEHKGSGNPDGHTLDEDGNLWQALYGGSKVIRITPDGEITGEVLLPTRNVTCCAFAGTDLYITTATEDEPGKYPESAKFAGNLFKVSVGVTGAKKHKVRLE